ncbi:hypothetical protein CL615_00990 [archaeon]|nr:hypothetical protein [archaeon]
MVFSAYVILTFAGYVSLFMSLVALVFSYFLITHDLKDKDNHKFYLVSLLLTALFLIFSSTGIIGSFLGLVLKAGLSIVALTTLLVYLFANLSRIVFELYNYMKEKYKANSR